MDFPQHGEVFYFYGQAVRLHLSHVVSGTEKKNSTSLFLPSSSSYPFPTLSEVGTTCFSSCCDKDSTIIFADGRLPDINPP
jgi:hypothetical protein